MIIAVDIGGTYIKYALLNDAYEIQKHWKKKTELFELSADFYDYLCKDLQGICDQNGCIGISMPGIVSSDGKIISKTSPLLTLLYKTQITKEVSQRCNELSTFVLNDAKAAGLCEVTIGQGKGCTSSVYWLIGTGIGGAFFIEDQLVKGINRIAGEFSHIPIEIKNNKTVGIARKTSISALIEMYNEKVSEEKKVSKGIEISIRCKQGDLIAKQVIDEWTTNNVEALLMITMILNPEIICIGGEVSNDLEIVSLIKRKFELEITHPFKEIVTTKIVTCTFKNEANLIGAAINAKKTEC